MVEDLTDFWLSEQKSSKSSATLLNWLSLLLNSIPLFFYHSLARRLIAQFLSISNSDTQLYRGLVTFNSPCRGATVQGRSPWTTDSNSMSKNSLVVLSTSARDRSPQATLRWAHPAPLPLLTQLGATLPHRDHVSWATCLLFTLLSNGHLSTRRLPMECSSIFFWLPLL